MLTERASLVATSASDARLLELVHPAGYVNPTPHRRYDLVVIGGGTAGLVAAIGAGVLGARVALIERGLLGGDCLNYGCVPSKALLHAARTAMLARSAVPVGSPALDIDFAAVMEQVRATRAAVAPHDALQQVSSFGVQVFLGAARFVARDAVEVGAARLSFRRAIVATGSAATVPPIAGLREAGYHTNETIFAMTRRPKRLVVLGGGPVGCELAQAFARLGCVVTLVQRGPRLLPREDGDVAALLATRFGDEGIHLLMNAAVVRVERIGEDRVVVLQDGTRIATDDILVAAGRSPRVEGLALERAEVIHDARGVRVDDRLQTSNPKIFAAGDVASAYKFTHAADALARVALQNALFFLRARASALVIPWCTFTDPEIAHVGITSREAERRRGVRTLTLALSEVDRSIVEHDGAGLARLHVSGSGRILGATLVAPHAGEAMGPVVMAMSCRKKVRDLGRAIMPYPTRSEVWRRLADQHALAGFTPRWRRVVERTLALLR